MKRLKITRTLTKRTLVQKSLRRRILLQNLTLFHRQMNMLWCLMKIRKLSLKMERDWISKNSQRFINQRSSLECRRILQVNTILQELERRNLMINTENASGTLEDITSRASTENPTQPALSKQRYQGSLRTRQCLQCTHMALTREEVCSWVQEGLLWVCQVI